MTPKIDVTVLHPDQYRRIPWKNGGGVATDIAAAHKPGSDPEDWTGMLWRFGFTAIAEPGPFSHLPGIERHQVVVKGEGLVLQTPDREIDLRQPFAPRRFDGETEITARLESGPVEVVNLLADRMAFTIALAVLHPDQPYVLTSGTHIAYACSGDSRLDVAEPVAVPQGHAARFDLRELTIVTARDAVMVLASVKAN